MPEEGVPLRERAANRREVRETYDRIAPHFAKTRPEPWTEVAAFLDRREGHEGLDVGAGNGRHAELLARSCARVIALDLSRAALDEASRRGLEKGFTLDPVAGDASALPVRGDSVDLAVYVATLHHLAPRSGRIASLDELARVLRPGGRGIVSAWCVTHDRFDAEVGFDTTVAWTLPDGTVVDRYYHIYDQAEFEEDLKESDLDTRSAFESRGNCYAIVGPAR